MATPLLTTKLYIPAFRSDLVPRPRLIERLAAGWNRDLLPGRYHLGSRPQEQPGVLQICLSCDGSAQDFLTLFAD
jgi:hypothetical protein